MLSLLLSSAVWIPNNTQSHRIERVQKRITKFISFKMNFHNTSYNERLNKLGLETLVDRRKLKILQYIQEIKTNSNSIPLDWYTRVEFTENDRIGTKIKTDFIRISKCEKSLFFFCKQIFNDLPIHIRNELNFKCFSNFLNVFYSVK